MASKIYVKLDTSKESFPSVKCKQNDDLILEADIFENAEMLNLTNKQIVIQALKDDRKYIIQNTEITKNNNKVIAELDRDFTRISGTTKIEIVLIESSKQNTTFSFYLEVGASVISGAVESTNTVTILEELENKIVEAGAVKEETEHLIQNGGAATTGDVARINASLEHIAYIPNELTTLGILNVLSRSDNVYIPDLSVNIENLILENKPTLKIEGSIDSVLKLKDSASNMINIKNSKTVLLKDLILDLNKENQINESTPYLNFEDCETLIVEKCFIKESFFRGIQANRIKTLIIKNSSFRDIQANALQLSNIENLFVVDNLFANIGDERSFRSGSSVYASYCKNVFIRGNLNLGNTDSTIYVTNSTGGKVIITDNIINHCGKEAIKTQFNTSKSIVSNNIIDGANINGIACNFNSGETIISSNHVHNTCLDQIKGNGSALGAIAILSTHNAVITDNIIKGTLEQNTNGIYSVGGGTFGLSSNIQINNNQIFYCAGEGIKADNVKTINIQGNICSQNARNMTGWSNQLYLQRVNGIVLGNYCSNSREERWEGELVGGNSFKMPKSSPNNPAFYNGATITLNLADTTTSMISIKRNIVSYDQVNKIITFDGNPISNEFKGQVNLNYLIEKLSSDPLHQIRFYGGDSNILFMANRLEKSQTSGNYIRNDAESSFIITPNPMNIFNSMGETAKFINEIKAGTTSNRPTVGIMEGTQYFDSNLQKLIIWNGSVWKDSTGNTV